MAKLADLVINLTMETASMTRGVDDVRSKLGKMGADVEKARGTLELLGDSLGIRLPRELRTVLARMESLNSFLKTAFTGAAIFAGFSALKEQVIPAIKEATTYLSGMDEALKSIEEDAKKASSALLFKMELAPTIAELQNVNTRIAEATKLRDELVKATGTPSNYGGFSAALGAVRYAADLAALHEINKQLATDEKERIGLIERIKTLNDEAAKKAQDAAKKMAEAAKQQADALTKVRTELEGIASKGVTDEFAKLAESMRADVDKINADLAQFPKLAVEGPQRIGGLVQGAITDYLNKIDALGQEAQKQIDQILSKTGELQAGLQKIPIPTPRTLPALSPEGQFQNYIEQQLKALDAQNRLNREVDEFLLSTGKAANGAKVFFREYAEYATNAAMVMHDAFARIFSALEDQLTNLLANFKFDFGSLMQTIRESLARAVVQKYILGPIAEKLGFGERGSSRQKPLYTEVTNLPPLLGSSEASKAGLPGGDILGKFQTEIGKIFSSIGSFLGSIGATIAGVFKSIIGLFGGGFAEGGDLLPGKFYLVGERGPELFAPGRNYGAVIPNHFLGGNTRTQNVTINQYITPQKSDPFGYSPSQLTNATLNGLARAGARA